MRPAELIRAALSASSTIHSTVSTVSTVITTSLVSSTPSGSSEPCSLIAAIGVAGSPVPAKLAYECLASVPVDVNGDSQLIDELKVLWDWHSEIGWLKNTPSTWDLGPIDLIQELDYIQGNLTNYQSEFDVQRDIQNLATRTGNFHFSYDPDILEVFSFQRAYAIVSISADGESLPKVYDIEDIADGLKDNDTEISAISKINNEDVDSFLEKVASYSQYTNIDARLNKLFFKAAVGESVGSFIIQESYQGDWSNVTFENGTKKAIANIAVLKQNFTSNITDGLSFFQNFCLGQVSGYQAPSPESKKGVRNQKRAAIPSTYPTPIAGHSGGAVAGYFLEGKGYEDVAVLKIITFYPKGEDENNGTEFQSVVADFMGNATQANKTKLIIDLRENGGGITALLLDTFMQLFPGEIPFSAQRYRAQEQYLLIGDRVSEIWNNETMSAAYTKQVGHEIGKDFRDWAYWHFLDVNNQNFDSWKEYSGPHTYNSDNFTTDMRYNLSNSDRISVAGPSDFYFTNTTKAPFQFAVDDTVMMLDGLCGSSCASFHEELKNIAGVKSVVIGGRPKTGVMQALGGTKGGEVIGYSSYVDFGVDIITTTLELGATTLNGTMIEQLANSTQALIRIGNGGRMQTQDAIRKGDDTEETLQYVYEAADCRIWLTSKMLFDPTIAWQSVWSAHTNNSLCVKNSTGDKSSIGGGFKPFGPGGLGSKMNQTNNTSESWTMANTSASPTSTGSPATVTINAAVVPGPQSLGIAMAMAMVLVAL